MKQVNFKELDVEVGIDEYQKIDFRKDIGNVIHRQATTVPMADLARKIYHSDGYVDIDNDDYSLMISVVSKSFALIISQAVERGTTELKDKEV